MCRTGKDYKKLYKQCTLSFEPFCDPNLPSYNTGAHQLVFELNKKKVRKKPKVGPKAIQKDMTVERISGGD